MFGYITASRKQLAPESWQRYSRLYCGLCRELGRRCGTASKLTLTYDMTFLVTVLSSVARSPEESGLLRCAAHPLRRRGYIRTEYTAYAADMNVLLAYHNLLDNWQDDRSLISLAGARTIRAQAQRIAAEYPRQNEAVRSALGELALMEQRGENNPDLPAACFGRLMAEIFVPDECAMQQELRAFGFALGRLIYIMDTCVDFARDIRKMKYNPLTGCTISDFEPMLELLAAECTRCFEALECERDRDIMENILYCGLWTNYRRKYSNINEKDGAVD